MPAVATHLSQETDMWRAFHLYFSTCLSRIYFLNSSLYISLFYIVHQITVKCLPLIQVWTKKRSHFSSLFPVSIAQFSQDESHRFEDQKTRKLCATNELSHFRFAVFVCMCVVCVSLAVCVSSCWCHVLMRRLLLAHFLSLFLIAALVWSAERYLSLIPLGKTNTSWCNRLHWVHFHTWKSNYKLRFPFRICSFIQAQQRSVKLSTVEKSWVFFPMSLHQTQTLPRLYWALGLCSLPSEAQMETFTTTLTRVCFNCTRVNTSLILDHIVTKGFYFCLYGPHCNGFYTRE